MSLEFEYVGTIPGTIVKAEIHNKGAGWWMYFLTNTLTGANSGVHDVYLPGIQLTHEQVARVAFEIWLAKGMDT